MKSLSCYCTQSWNQNGRLEFQVAHQGFHASSGTSSLACGTALWALWPHDSSRLMTQHASWWRLMVAPYDSMFHRCQSCDVAMCFCKFCQDQFDTKVYGIVIQSLVEEPGPLPTLFMRTVIQVVCSPSHWNKLKRRVWKTQIRDTKGISSECFKDLQVGSKGYLERLQEAFEVKELPRLSDFIVMGDTSQTCSARSLGRREYVVLPIDFLTEVISIHFTYPPINPVASLRLLLIRKFVTWLTRSWLRRGFMIVLQHTFASQANGCCPSSGHASHVAAGGPSPRLIHACDMMHFWCFRSVNIDWCRMYNLLLSMITVRRRVMCMLVCVCVCERVCVCARMDACMQYHVNVKLHVKQQWHSIPPLQHSVLADIPCASQSALLPKEKGASLPARHCRDFDGKRSPVHSGPLLAGA